MCDRKEEGLPYSCYNRIECLSMTFGGGLSVTCYYQFSEMGIKVLNVECIGTRSVDLGEPEKIE